MHARRAPQARVYRSLIRYAVRVRSDGRLRYDDLVVVGQVHVCRAGKCSRTKKKSR